MAKSKKVEEIVKEPIVYVIKNTGRGAVLAYTQSRFNKFESSMRKSGWVPATKEQIEKAGFAVAEVIERELKAEEPKWDDSEPKVEPSEPTEVKDNF